MNKLSKSMQAVIGAGLLLGASQAHALLISATGDSTGNPSQPTYQAEIATTDVGQSFTLDWLVPAGTGALPINLSASTVFSINAFNFDVDSTGTDEMRLGIDIFNTTDLSAYPNSNTAIVSFGFGVNPDATASILSTDGIFDGIGDGSGQQQTFPGGFKRIDVCIFSSGCSGGDVKEGLQAGNSTSLEISLLGDFENGATLLDFPLKFQGTWGSFETPGHSVPEPGTLALFGASLLGMGINYRRRKRNIVAA